MSAPDIDYICVGICRVDPESGICQGCGRPPPDATPAADSEPSRYPLASEFAFDLSPSGDG